MRVRRHLSLIVPVALLAAGCANSSDTSSSAASSTTVIEGTPGGVDVGTAADPDADSADKTTTTTPTTTTPTTTTPATTTPAADPEQCVLGTWELRAQNFFDQITASVAAGGGATMNHLGGRHVATFNADGTAEGLRESWSFEVASPEGSLIITVDATDTGTWAIDGDTMTVASQEQTFESTFEMVVGGVRQPLPMAPPNTVQAEAFGGAGPYTCEGDVLSITLTDAGVTITNTWDRIAG